MALAEKVISKFCMQLLVQFSLHFVCFTRPLLLDKSVVCYRVSPCVYVCVYKEVIL